MKHALKTALTLLATLALLLGHGGFGASVSAKPTKKMGCCGDACPTHCCVEESDSSPAGPLPAVPANTSSQQLQAALLPVLLGGFALEFPASPAPAHFPGLSPAASPVPLYVRTHSFLI